jgi:oligoribonuclease
MTMYLWIDLETTGLDPDNDRIIEVGWFLSERTRQITDEQSVLITPDKIAWELMQQDLFVQTMHTQNELLSDMERFGSIMPEDAEDQILEDLAKYEDELFILAGSSVHFDRGFIRNWMPRLDRKLMHRHMDVSTIKLFLQDLDYGFYVERQHETKHRAMSDVVDSFNLYVRCAELIEDLSSDLAKVDEDA